MFCLMGTSIPVTSICKLHANWSPTQDSYAQQETDEIIRYASDYFVTGR